MKFIRKTKYGFPIHSRAKRCREVSSRAMLIGLLFSTPFGASAVSTLNEIELAALNVLNKTVPVLIAVAVAFFLWNVLKYVNSGDNAEERVQARAFMTYGIIAIFVMVSLWGLVWVLRDTFNLNNNTPVDFNDIILEL